MTRDAPVRQSPFCADGLLEGDVVGDRQRGVYNPGHRGNLIERLRAV
jgi:hypothetical protein